jgi:hypothetical protein
MSNKPLYGYLIFLGIIGLVLFLIYLKSTGFIIG